MTGRDRHTHEHHEISNRTWRVLVRGGIAWTVGIENGKVRGWLASDDRMTFEELDRLMRERKAVRL